MKKALIAFKGIAAVALLALAAGCATGNRGNDETAVAAGFKIITPTTADQKALFARLPKNKVTPVQYRGVTYFVMPDSSNGLAYVGNSAQYSVYQEMRLQKRMSNEELQAAQLDQMDQVDWGAWGGADAAFVGGFAR
ncbi:hypothetical protein QTH87_19355 [Variovorax sp. J22P168]|uniref:hypothetical protein n=1 Tax=Variovorax jilinensis TaxID=3053513 RepID=UPI002575402F|nr:hypothetical protein [Variovorax sp. J22P168]MDM0014609.1 hypothetical protein [Variovorax sp. J22P168]